MRPTLRSNAAIPLIALIAVASVGVDSLRLGFYSDDWLLLDAARRSSWQSELLGQHGIWPWFRPLSRELYFLGIVAAGPLGLWLARLCATAAIVVSAVALYRLAPRVLGGRGGAVAAAAFLVFSFTKYLAAWASGFQDLAATAFVLAALWAYDRKQRGLALVCAGAAMFSKETGFAVVPLLLFWEALVARHRPGRGWSAALAGLTAGAIAIHVAVRATWPVQVAASASPSGHALWTRLADFAAGFWMPGLPPDTQGAILGALAAAGALALAFVEPRATNDLREPQRPVGRIAGFGFIALLVAGGLAPTVLAHWGRLAPTLPWHAFPATPGLCLAIAALASRLPRVVVGTALAAFVAVSVWGQAYVEPSAEILRTGGKPVRGWYAQVLIDARTRRLERDLRALLAERPESLVVLYEGLPHATFLQTGDGPATREMLGDPTIRTYFLGDAPRDLAPKRLRILISDPLAMRLLEFPSGAGELQMAAITNLMRGETRSARALLAYARAERDWSSADAYIDAVAAGLDQGPRAMLDALDRAGMGDSSGAAIDHWADSIGGTEDFGVQYTFRDVLRNPSSATAHYALGETLRAREAHLPAVLEYRIAGSLTPEWGSPHLRLGEIYRLHGRWAQARGAFGDAERSSRPAGAGAEARRSLDALAADSARTPFPVGRADR